MSIVACEVPSTSILDHRVVEGAYFRDAYSATVTKTDVDVVEIFFSIFGHTPWWMKLALVTRNRIASLCGLDAPTSAEIMNPDVKSSYRVGEKIGPWPIFSITKTELIAGRDNKHLDFRLSVMKVTNDQVTSTVISTVCTVHNRFGKVYLFFIVPFHKWGLKQLILRAIIAGRL